MSFRINYNSAAVGSQINLSGVQTDLDKSIRKLSSGLRLSKPQDNVTDFVGAEAIRSQLKAFEQSSRNSQDAINLSKILDSSLSEVSRLLSNARSIAVTSGSTATTSSAQLASNQNELMKILESIDRIAGSTRWGETRLLDGSAGASTTNTNSALVSQIGFGGVFNGFPLSSGPVTATQSVTALQSQITTNVGYAGPTSVLNQGSVTLNGYTFVTDGTHDTVQSLMSQINSVSSQTGIFASFAGGNMVFTAMEHGAQQQIQLNDPNGVLSSVPTPALTIVGRDAVVDVQLPTENGVQTVQFRGGRNSGDNGLLLTDSEGNTIRLDPTGNGNSALLGGSLIGNVSMNNATRFQLGTLPSEIVSLGLPDIRSSQLASGIVGAMKLSDIDVTTTGGATLAIQVLDAAIEQVSSVRANIGAFQKHTLESRDRELNIQTENLSATESDLRDLDVALEMTEFTKLQIVQQTGVSILSQANQLPEQVLNLLR